MIVQIIVILCGDNAADGYQNILTAAFGKFFHQSRQQGLVTGSQGGEAYHVNVVVHCILCGFFRSLEQRPYVNVPAHVSEGGRQNFLSAVMTVLTHLSQEDTRPAAFQFFKLFSQRIGFFHIVIAGEFAAVYAGYGVDNRIETTGYFFDRVGDFAQGCTVAGCLYGTFQQVAVFTAFRCCGQGCQVTGNGFRIPFRAQFFQTFDLGVTNGGVIDGQYVQRVFLGQTVFVQADDGFLAAVDISLTTGRAFFDTHLRQAGSDSFGHTAQGFNFLDVRPGTADDLVGEVFQIVGAAPRIDDLADFGLVLDVQLGVTCQTCGEVGRQRDGFVQCVGMQGLGVAQCRGHSFHTGTGDVVERILFGEGPAGSLGVGTQCHGFRILGAEALQNLRPQYTGRTHLGNFHEVVLAHIPEEGQTFCEGVNLQARSFTGADVFHAVGQGVA